MPEKESAIGDEPCDRRNAFDTHPAGRQGVRQRKVVDNARAPFPDADMHRAHAIQRSFLFAALIFAAGGAVAADAPEAPILVQVNNLTRDDAPLIHGMGLVADALVNADQRREYAKIPLRYDVMRRAVPDFDMPAAFRAALRCLPSPTAKEDCRDVELHAGSAKQPGLAPATSAVSTTRVALAIGFRHPYAAMTFSFTFSEVDPVMADDVRKQFVFVYNEPVASPDNGYPFADPATDTLSASEATARSYWFDGHPSRFETSLRGALEEFRQFTAMYYERAGGPDVDPATMPWWSALGRTGELKEKGLIKCLWMACKRPYFRVQDGRIWYVPDSGKPSQFYVSDPLTAWGGKPAASP